jgi:hypothetical protein
MDRLAQEMQHEADLELAKRRLIAEGFSDVFDTSVFLETERAQAKNTPFRQRDVDEDEDDAQDNQQTVSGAPLALTNLDQDEEHKTHVMLSHLNQDLSMSDRWIDTKLRNINRKILRGEY